MFRVGVIGIGTMGKNHARVYSELPSVDLIGIADINKSRVINVSKQYSTKAFENYKDLLKEDLDAVSIAVPTIFHKKIAIDVAKSGINMLIEKPIADTIKNAKKIIEIANNNNVKLMIGHIERFNPIIPVIIKSIKNSQVISIHIMRVGPLPPRIRDVGIIIDFAIHDIDLVRYITNSNIKEIYGLTSRTFSKYEDTAILSFKTDTGVLIQIYANWLTPFKVREIRISTTDKYIIGSFIEQKVSEYRKCEDNAYLVKSLNVITNEPLRLELESFLQSIETNQKVPITGEDGLKALKIALKCLK